MNSNEIEELLKLKNDILEVKDYIDIITTSPQIIRINYNHDENSFDLLTSDNYKFKIKIKKPCK